MQSWYKHYNDFFLKRKKKVTIMNITVMAKQPQYEHFIVNSNFSYHETVT